MEIFTSGGSESGNVALKAGSAQIIRGGHALLAGGLEFEDFELPVAGGDEQLSSGNGDTAGVLPCPSGTEGGAENLEAGWSALRGTATGRAPDCGCRGPDGSSLSCSPRQKSSEPAWAPRPEEGLPEARA